LLHHYIKEKKVDLFKYICNNSHFFVIKDVKGIIEALIARGWKEGIAILLASRAARGIFMQDQKGFKEDVIKESYLMLKKEDPLAVAIREGMDLLPYSLYK